MTRIAMLVAAALLVAGCGDDDGSTTTAQPPPADDGGIRSADHDDRDRAAEADEEPNVGTPGNQDPSGGKVDIPIRDRRFTQRAIGLKMTGRLVVSAR